MRCYTALDDVVPGLLYYLLECDRAYHFNLEIRIKHVSAIFQPGKKIKVNFSILISARSSGSKSTHFDKKKSKCVKFRNKSTFLKKKI